MLLLAIFNVSLTYTSETKNLKMKSFGGFCLASVTHNRNLVDYSIN